MTEKKKKKSSLSVIKANEKMNAVSISSKQADNTGKHTRNNDLEKQKKLVLVN